MSSLLLNVLDQGICIRLTQTLLHLLWEGLAIGLCTLALARLCQTATARVRYLIHAVSLGLMALCLPITLALTDASRLPQVERVAKSVEPAVFNPAAAQEPVLVSQGTSTGIVIEPVPSMPPAEIEGAFPSVELIPQPAAPIALAVPQAGESLFEHALRRASPYATVAYFLGVVAMLGRLCCALWAGHRLRRCAVPIRDRQLLTQIRRQATRIGLKIVPIVAYCERITIPAVAGILRPMILLPFGIGADLDTQQILVIVAHEMAHIRRFDLVVNLLQRLVETVLFFHPAVWYVSRQLSFERENCCDDAVLQAGYENVYYADTLVRVAELCASARRPIPTTFRATLAASGNNDSQLKHRVLRLLGAEQRLRLTRADSLTLVLVAGLVAGTMAGLWRHALAAPPKDAGTNATQVSEKLGNTDATPAGERGGVSPPVPSEVEFAGNVVDAEGKPMAGAEIWVAAPPIEPDNPAAQGIVRQMARSDEQGKFSFRFEPIRRPGLDATTWTHWVQVTAKAAGFGCDWLPLAVFEKNPVPSEKRDELQQRFDGRLGAGFFAGRTLRLPPEAGPVRGRLLDLEGRPRANVTVSVEDIDNPDSALLSQAFKQNSKDVFFQALNAHNAWGVGITRHEWQRLIPPVQTNEKGEFSLSGLGRDQMATVTFAGEGVAAERLFILGKEMETEHLPHIRPGGAMDVFVGTRFTHAVGPAVPVSGIVTEFKSGKPIAGATVFVERLFGRDATMKGPGKLRLGTNHMCTVTDDQGRYRLIGIPPGEAHVLNVIAPKSEPWLIARQEVSLDPSQSSARVNVQVFRGIWLEGRVTDAATGEPVPGHVDYLALQKNPNIPQKFGLQDDWQIHRFPTDQSGHYRVPGLSGPGVLLVRASGKTVYPLSVGAEDVEGYNPKNNYLPTTPTGLPLSNWNRVLQIDPPVQAQSHTLDLTLSAGASLVGRVVGPSGAAVSNVEGSGLVKSKTGFFSDLAGGRFTIYNYEPAVPRDLFFKANGNSLVGHLHVEGAPPAELLVTLQPAVTVRGRLIETETGDEAVGYGVDCTSTTQGHFRIDDTVTDEKGRFEIKGLLAGNVYKMDASNPQHFDNQKNGFTIDLTNAKPGDVLELGDVTGKNAKPNEKPAGERGGVSPPVAAPVTRQAEFSGNVVDADGKPLAGAEIWLAARAIDPDDPAARGIVRQLARSDEQGKFSFRLAPVDTGATDAVNWTHGPQVTAKAAGYGCDWLPLAVFETNPVSSAARDAFQQWLEKHKRLRAGRFTGRTLTLPPEAGPVRGRLVDLEGRPLSNVSISIERIVNLDSALLNQAFKQTSKDVFEKALHAWASSTSITRSEWQALVPPVKTNENGEFSLPGLGRDQLTEVTFSGERVAAERLFILGRETETKHLPHNSGDAVYVGTRFTHAVGPAVPVNGVVTDFKSGKPITGAMVLVQRLFGGDRTNSRNLWEQIDHIRTVTDDQGRYRLVGIPPGKGHVLNVIPPKSEPWLIASQELSLDPDQKIATVNVQVFRGIWLEGRVTDAATGEPVAGDVDYLALQKNPNIPQRFGLQEGFKMGRFSIDESGHYRVAGLPGPGVLLVRAFRAKTVYPRGAGAEKVDGYDPQRVFLPTTPVALRFEEWHRIVQIDPPVDAQEYMLDLTLSAGASLVGRVVGPSGVALANVEAAGVVEKDWFFNDLQLKDGKFTINNYEPAVPRNLFFRANGNSLVGYFHLEGAPPAELTVTLQPAVTVRGRLIETETGVEAVGYHLYCQSTRQGEFRLDDVTTDENGRFELKGLLAGNVYTMEAGNPQYFYSGKNGFTIDLTKAKPGDVLELGDVTGKNAKSATK